MRERLLYSVHLLKKGKKKYISVPISEKNLYNDHCKLQPVKYTNGYSSWAFRHLKIM